MDSVELQVPTIGVKGVRSVRVVSVEYNHVAVVGGYPVIVENQCARTIGCGRSRGPMAKFESA